jgi:hypothetical protein
MGEILASGEGILGNFAQKKACCVKDEHILNTGNVAFLHSFYSDKLKDVYSRAFSYNNCKFILFFEEALVVGRYDWGEKYDC